MKQIFTLFSLALFTLNIKAQMPLPATPSAQGYGKIDRADLDLKLCDFEQDANAEILFDKGSVYFDSNYNIILDRHVRIKIFNDKGKDEANVKIQYYGGNHVEYISGVQAETINLNNDQTEFTKIDKKQIYTVIVDKYRTALSFSFANVKPGSVIEYKYTITSNSISDFPDWYFQNDIPTRYSEINTTIPDILFYKNLVMVNQPYVINTTNKKAIANIPSINDEPYMSSKRDNSERILYQLTNISAGSFFQNFSDTWTKVGEDEMDYDDFGGQFHRKLTGEEIIIAKAKNFSLNADKVACIFNEVKNMMKWDEVDERYTSDGTVTAWNKKTGNSTEINLILYHLLTKAGVKAYPMLVSTRANGKVNPAYPSKYQFNRTVTYVPIDSTRFYLLDATNKYNAYNDIPSILLNGFGLYMDKENKKHELKFIEKSNPVKQVVLINAEIRPDGKLNGTAQLYSFSYNRIDALERYKADGEKKYTDYLRDNDNNLKISSVKLSNMEIDTIPLAQTIDFDLTLTGSDDNYIYLNPNLFTPFHKNPFLAENRFTNIDFGYCSSYSMNGVYKIPAGYKVEAMPKNISMSMPDKSIAFKRLAAEQDGSLVIRYTVNYQKSIFFKENYPEFHEFFKKMFELMNEQIVMKKI